MNIKLSDKFNIDDILAEFSEGKGDRNDKKQPSDNAGPLPESPGATMILRDLDKKKSGTEKPVSEAAASANGKSYDPSPVKKAESVSDNKGGSISYKGLEEFEEKKTPAAVKTSRPAHTKKTEVKAQSPATSPATENVRKNTVSPAVRTTESKSGKDSKEKSHRPVKSNVAVNSSSDMSFIDKIKQYRFLFEELTKRDFKKKYKRTLLGVLWSVISPFVTFLVQYFVFGYIFRRHDTQFVIYLLSGTLMFNFFTNATTAGMFSMYSNGGILSKVNVPKSLFVLSSNSAAIFNFLLTLVIYFGFMVFCHVSFGVHLLMMIFPILCLIIFNIGMSYILSSLFVFFRDMQYLYQIFTMLLMYMSAIFYEIDRFPENLRFVFDINPIYHFVTYIRQLVIYATVPDLTSHIICLAFAFGMLAIGYFVHRKTEQKFVYYY